MRQVALFSSAQLGGVAPREHGGSVRAGLRKLARPFDGSRPLHIVLRSSRATGAWSLRLRSTEVRVRETLNRLARRHGIRVYRFAAAGNHLHMLARARR